MSNRADKEILNELKELTKDKENWKSNIDDVAHKLNDDYSVAVKAKALWLLGEMGLKYPKEIECHVNDIASYLENDDSKLRERSANAIGRIGRADKDLVIVYMDKLMKMKEDESSNVRHAIEAPEMFRVIGKIRPNCVKPYLEKLEYFAENDENPVVRIHSAGAIRITKKALGQ